MQRLFVFLALIVAFAPSQSWAACHFEDGTAAPEPGFSETAMHSTAWGPKFVELFNNLSNGDKSTLVGVIRQGNASLMTSKCSPNDLFWTHLSLVGLSEVDEAAVAAEIAHIVRAYKLTGEGRKTLPLLLGMKPAR